MKLPLFGESHCGTFGNVVETFVCYLGMFGRQDKTTSANDNDNKDNEHAFHHVAGACHVKFEFTAEASQVLG